MYIYIYIPTCMHAQEVAKLNQIKDSLGHVRALTTTVGGLKQLLYEAFCY